MDLFTELSLIIVIAAVISGIMKLLKQPLVIGYILTGLVAGPLFLGLLYEGNSELLRVFSEMGVSFLLFIVGLHLSPNEIKDLGKSTLIIGFVQVLISFGLGFLVSSLLLNFNTISSVYVGIALSFSSTIVVLKFLADKKDLEKLYGRMSIGILLFQDVVAAVVLIAFAAMGNGDGGVNSFLLLLVKGILLTSALVLVSLKVLPKLSRFFADSPEYLFIFSVAWGFGLASLFNYLGFSIEIGALVAGVALSVSIYAQEISARLKSLRDFFVVMFFISLGSEIVFGGGASVWLAVFLITLLAVIVKPLLIGIIMSLNKYTSKTSISSGLSLAQISEFSLIIAFIGVDLGHIDHDLFAILALVALFSITLSTYFIKYTDALYPKLLFLLKPFKRSAEVERVETLVNADVILFGCSRVGYDFIRVFKKMGNSFLAVDFDPDVVEELLQEGINVKYGDVEDGDFLEDISVDDAKVVISSVQDFEAGIFLLNYIRERNQSIITVLTASDLEHALVYYEKGADYVLLPHFIGGQIAAQMTKHTLIGAGDFIKARKDHIEYLQERKRLGHSSPF